MKILSLAVFIAEKGCLMKLFSVTKEHPHIAECFLHTFHIAQGVPHSLNKVLNSSVLCLGVYDTVQGCLTYLQEVGGAGHSKDKRDQQGSKKGAEQMRAALEGQRKRGMDAKHGRGKQRGMKKFHAGAVITMSVAKIPGTAGGRFP